VVTDEDPRDVVVKMIKAKLLDHLTHALPYSLHPEIEAWEVNRQHVL
jgi:GTPase Era involved in 16S rRNA processing